MNTITALCMGALIVVWGAVLINNAEATTVSFEGNTFDVQASLSNGSVKSMDVDADFFTLIVKIETSATKSGELTITLPRALVDSKANDVDDEFFIIVDGDLGDYKEISATGTERTIVIPISAGVEEVEIVGTQVGSKETPKQPSAPTETPKLVTIAQQSKMLEIESIHDAYVLSIANDPTDALGFQTINTGNDKFLKVLYVWNPTGVDDLKLSSTTYLKFDLTDIVQDQVVSAKLKMYAEDVKLTGASTSVDLVISFPLYWDESTVTYQNAPAFIPDPVATTSINRPGWYEWDLTDAVKENAGSDLTLAVIMKNFIDNNSEEITFTSKDADDPSLRPKLVIERVVTISAGKPTVSSTSFDSIPVLLGGMGIGAVSGIAGFVAYKRSHQNSRPHVSSQAAPKETYLEELSCPNCGRKIYKDFKICPFCVYNLNPKWIKCSRCGKDIATDYKVCPYCGRSNL